MEETFKISFEAEGKHYTADVEGGWIGKTSVFTIKIGDTIFKIKPGEDDSTDHIFWVDDDGDNTAIYQAAGEAVERYWM